MLTGLLIVYSTFYCNITTLGLMYCIDNIVPITQGHARRTTTVLDGLTDAERAGALESDSRLGGSGLSERCIISVHRSL